MRVRDVMRPSPKPIKGDETVQLAAERMRRESVGFLVIGDERSVEGMVTDRDLSVRCTADGKSPSLTPVREVMSASPISCRDDEPVEDVVERMSKTGVARLPVFDRKGKLVGVVSSRDLEVNLPGTTMSRRKAQKVQFTKEIVTSKGDVHHVPVQNVYVTGAEQPEEAEEKAIERFKSAAGVRDWRLAADRIEVEKDD